MSRQYTRELWHEVLEPSFVSAWLAGSWTYGGITASAMGKEIFLSFLLLLPCLTWLQGGFCCGMAFFSLLPAFEEVMMLYCFWS